MKFSEIDLQCEDIMWFGVDKNGVVFECTTGGIGNVPSFVCNSKEDTSLLEEFFLGELEKSTVGYLLLSDTNTPLALDAKDLAEKGIVCFDVELNDPSFRYKKISSPEVPLKVTYLPEPIQALLQDHCLDVDVISEDYIRVPHHYDSTSLK